LSRALAGQEQKIEGEEDKLISLTLTSRRTDLALREPSAKGNGANHSGHPL
jgi:hypothetical protein